MPSKFSYLKPKTLADTVHILAESGPEAKILAGGTDLLVGVRRRQYSFQELLDIKGLPEVNRFDYTPGQGLLIGAAVTMNQLAESVLVQERYPALAAAARSVASYQLRNRATAVGNICNASPGADLAPALLIFDAVVHIARRQGQREVPLADFFVGVKRTVLSPQELVTGIFLPDPGLGDRSIFLKQSRLKGHDLAIVNVAVRLTPQQKICLAMGAVAPTPLRLAGLEELLDAGMPSKELAEKAAAEVKGMIKPISDVRASAAYREHLAGVLVRRGLERVLAGGVNDHVRQA